MALGDSITAGVSAGGRGATSGGYRGTLATLLSHNGVQAQFVGTRHDYSAAIANRAHEGWPGYVLRSFPANPGPGQLYGELTRRAITREKPDVVLLMAGTNDLIRLTHHVPGYTMPHVLDSMNLLLGEIFSIDPHVRVIVAPVVASPIIATSDLDKFNNGLTPIVASYAIRG
ncbi:MAG: SGNH/GDSL hydrolase family protein, partial [Vulcanimicrobiaceae bacterium]